MENTDDQSKTNALQRVIYSMLMYIEAYEYFEQNHINRITVTSPYALEMKKSSDVDTFLNNLLLESLLLHIRNVMDFFYRLKSMDKKSDICITDFTGESREIFDELGIVYTSDLYKVKDKINKYLSHLTDEEILLSDTRDWKTEVDYANKYLFQKCLDFLELSTLNKYQLNPKYEDNKKVLINYLNDKCGKIKPNIPSSFDNFSEKYSMYLGNNPDKTESTVASALVSRDFSSILKKK